MTCQWLLTSCGHTHTTGGTEPEHQRLVVSRTIWCKCSVYEEQCCICQLTLRCRRWDEEFELLVHEPEHQQLTAVLLEHHALDQDDEVGRVSIAIDELAIGETQDLWLDLGPPGTDQQNSLLSLSVSFLSLGDSLLSL